MRERLSVVCAPSLIAGRKRPRSPQDLLRHPLLTSHSHNPFEWPAWARLTGVDLGGVQNVPLHDYNIVIEAALAGQGVAMGRHRMIAAQLASGALVEALPGLALDDPRIGWWLVTPRARRIPTCRRCTTGWSKPLRRPARRSDPRSLAPLAFDQCCLEPRSMRQACRQAPATHYFYSCVPGKIDWSRRSRADSMA